MSTADITDDGLGRAALAGDRDAFTALFARHERGLYNVAHRLTGSSEDAADITQEAFLRVFARLDDLAGREVNLPAYLHRTARNLVYDRSARRARETPVDDVALAAGADPALDADPALSALVAAQGADVRAANARLPERHRLALALRELEDMSYEDIGRVLDTTLGAVAALLVRARLALRRELRLGQVDTAAMDPGCRARLGDVGALIDGELDADRAHVLSQHLELCPSCRAARAAFEEARVSYRAWLPLPVLALGASTAKAAEARGLVRFGGSGRRAAGARGARAGAAASGGRRVGALVASGLAGALILFGAPTLVALRSGSEPPSPLPEPAAAAPATTAAGTTSTPRTVTAPPATTGPAVTAAPAALPAAAPLTTAGRPGEPPALDPVVTRPRRTRTTAPARTATRPAATVAGPAPAPGTTSAPPADPPPATTSDPPPPTTTDAPPATTEPPPRTTIPTTTDAPPGGVF